MSTTEPRRRSRLFHPSADHLIPRDQIGVPPAVAEANAAAWALFDRLAETSVEHRVAKDRLAAAPRADAAARTAAAAAGTDAPAPIEPIRRAELQAAELNREATLAALKDAILVLFDAVGEVKDEWCRDADVEVERATAALHSALDDVRERYAALQSARTVAGNLHSFDGNPTSSALGTTRRIGAEQLAQQEQKASERLRQSRRGGLIEREVASLLAAVRFIADNGETSPDGTVGW